MGKPLKYSIRRNAEKMVDKVGKIIMSYITRKKLSSKETKVKIAVHPG